MHHHQLFSDKSDLYEKARPRYPIELFEYLSTLKARSEIDAGYGSRRNDEAAIKRVAWDCACGSGQAAIDLVRLYDRVIATDVSPSQIANAKPHNRVDYRVCESENSGLSRHSVDLVCVAQALHWFNFSSFWSEVDRVLKPGGVFSAFGYNFPKVNSEFDDFFQRRILDVVAPYWAPQNRLIWDGYRQVEFPFIKHEAPNFVMQVDWDLDGFFDFVHTFSAVRRYFDLHGDGFFINAYDDAKLLWDEPTLKKKISFDLVFYAGTKG